MKIEAKEAMNELRNYKTHPLISSKPIISLKLIKLLEETFYLGAMGQFSPFNSIVAYISRIERLSQRNIALQLIKEEFNTRNSKVEQAEFKKNINKIIAILREALK